MPLTALNPELSYFFEFPAVLFDTCAITWFANRDSGLLELSQISKSYCVLVPTPVLYELAFGLPEQASADLISKMTQLTAGVAHVVSHLSTIMTRLIKEIEHGAEQDSVPEGPVVAGVL